MGDAADPSLPPPSQGQWPGQSAATGRFNLFPPLCVYTSSIFCASSSFSLYTPWARIYSIYSVYIIHIGARETVLREGKLCNLPNNLPLSSLLLHQIYPPSAPRLIIEATFQQQQHSTAAWRNLPSASQKIAHPQLPLFAVLISRALCALTRSPPNLTLESLFQLSLSLTVAHPPEGLY